MTCNAIAGPGSTGSVKALRETTASDRSVGGGSAAGTPGKQTLVEQLGRQGAGPGEVVVTASSLRVRSSPDTSSKANVKAFLSALGQILNDSGRKTPTEAALAAAAL